MSPAARLLVLVGACTLFGASRAGELASTTFKIQDADLGEVTCGSAGLPRSVTASLVGDGICDCCDGADEAPGTCEDVCPGVAAADAAALSQFVSASEKGAARVAKILPKPDAIKAAVQRLHKDFEKAVKDMEALQWRVKSEAARLQAAYVARKHFSQREMLAFEALQGRAQVAAGRAMQLQAQSSIDFGPNRRYAVLLASLSGCCVSPPLNEKVTKGGSTTSLPKTYAYVVCGFAHVSQVEVRPDRWTRGEALAKGEEGSTEDERGDVRTTGPMERESVAVGADGGVGPASGGGQAGGRGAKPHDADRLVADSATLLGSFRGYIPLAQLDAHVLGGRTDNPSAYGGQDRAPKQPKLYTDLPPLQPSLANTAAAASERDIGAVAAVYEGPDQCRSADMVLPRRAYVFHVCPGTMPASVRKARAAVIAASAGKSAGGSPNKPGKAVAGWAAEGVSAGLWPPISEGWNGNATVDGPMAQAVIGAATGSAADGGSADPSSLARVVHVEEDGMCTYYLTVETPLACSKQRARDVKQAMQVIGLRPARP